MKPFDIHARIFAFVIDTLKVVRLVPTTVENKVIVNQLIRSVTSCGANDQEADGVSTKRDFIHCYTIVRKELKETKYWLSVLSALDATLEAKLRILLKENGELIKIVSAIISKAAVSVNKNQPISKSTNNPISNKERIILDD